MKSLQVRVEVWTDRGLLTDLPAGLDHVDDGGLGEEAVLDHQLEHVAHAPPRDAVAREVFLDRHKVQHSTVS